MDKVAKAMTKAGEQAESSLRPKRGDQFRCEACGMQLQVTADCQCEDEPAHFRCCGQDMEKL
jgi:hypothetical protein